MIKNIFVFTLMAITVGFIIPTSAHAFNNTPVHTQVKDQRNNHQKEYDKKSSHSRDNEKKNNHPKKPNTKPLPTQAHGCDNPKAAEHNPHCQQPVSVPEFGLITGAVAMLTSGGTLLAFRRMRKA